MRALNLGRAARFPEEGNLGQPLNRPPHNGSGDAFAPDRQHHR